MISLWILQLDDAGGCADENALRSLLPSSDLERIAGYQDQRARLQFLGGRALLRHALSQTADLHPHAWSFQYGERGKPGLARPFDRTGLAFSISHSADVVVCALATGRNLGVDIEWLGRRVDECGIARRFFSTQEAEDIDSRSGSERTRRFFASWTLREAYVKARGDGLFHSLEGVVCEMEGCRGAPRLLDHGDHAGQRPWAFSLWEPIEGYCMALCQERKDREEKLGAAIEGRLVTLARPNGSIVPQLSASNAPFSPRKYQ